MITVRDRREDLTKSFTDESSPRLPKSTRKVSIHGQVIREGDSLKWFRDLIRLYPNDSPETKSLRILEDFRSYPQEFRDRTKAGMKKVRIHIVDSLSYEIDYKKILENIFKADEVRKMLDRDARRGDDFAKYIKKKMDETVGEWIIQDSTSHRLRYMIDNPYPLGSISFLLRPVSPVPRFRPVDLSPFRTKASSVTTQAVKAASKSASVFTSVMDQLSPMAYLDSSWRRLEVHNALRDSHAFDKGDDRTLRWIEEERKDIGRGGFPGGLDYVDDFSYETYSEFAYGELYSLASHESEYVQAADIAAGFAREAYEKYSVVAVAEAFEYVTINGERITQNNAQERFEYWGQLHAQERRKTQSQILRIEEH